MTLQNKRLIYILLTIPILLLIPFIAMQVSTEVNWSLIDFVVMGALLIVTALMIELIFRKVKTKQYRILLSIIVLLALLLIWAELAVGIFGSPFAGS